MYLTYYQLSLKPFQITADPKFLWLGEKHSEALATLKYGILEDKGFLLLTGDVGTGKTALIKRLVKTIDVAALVATVPDPGLEPMDFFNFLAEEFQMGRRYTSKGDFLIDFKRLLLKAYSSHQKVLLVVDEAQRLNHELLEQIRLFSNIELDNRKLINIFFVGQTEFHRLLLEERNRAVRQRISVSYFIQPLTELETQQYIRHRLRVAGAKREIFTEDAMRRIFAFARGYPRLVNIICDHALLTGFSLGEKIIDVALIRDCEQELRLAEPEDTPPRVLPAEAPVAATSPSRPAGWRVPTVLVFLLLLAFTGYMIYQHRAGEPQRWAVEEIAPQDYKGLSGRPAPVEGPPDPKRDPAPPAPPQAPPQPASAGGGTAPVPAAKPPPPPSPFAEGKVIIYFSYNSNELPKESYDLLDQVADHLLTNPDIRAAIKGYTDSAGNPSYNVSVSQFRANSIKSYLVGKGVDGFKLTATGLGPNNPIAANDTVEGREQNRRVEIELTKPRPR
jgi:general secretion pathway protein A